MPRKNSSEIRAYGIRVLLSQHPQLRRLKRQYAPSAHGNRFWTSSWLLMDFLRRQGLSKYKRVMEVGCGWGLAGIYCAKKYGAQVTAVDIDPEVFPYLHLHAGINNVKISILKKSFGGLTAEHLKNINLLIGADICFWDKMVYSLKRLINRALKTGVGGILIADPGRPTFDELAAYFVGKRDGELLDWTIQRPRRMRGRILKLGFPRPKKQR